MSETMENAALNSGEIADRTPAAKAEETKADKFIRLGEYRMNKAIDAIGRIENLANRSAYEYTPEQVEAMFSVLESKVAEVKAKFTVTKNKEKLIVISEINGVEPDELIASILEKGIEENGFYD